MKIGYFDGSFGAAGDMIVAALLDAGLPLPELQKELKKLPLSGYRISQQAEERFDPRIGHHRPARRFLVDVVHKEHGRSFQEILALVEKSRFSGRVKEKVRLVFSRLAAAEKAVHGKLPDHFHQVGETDSIVDIFAAVAGLDLLAVEKIYCSVLNLGAPAPATIEIMKNLPVKIIANLPELTTPTAAAVLAEIAVFEPPPLFFLQQAGFGAGSRTEPAPNILTFFFGQPMSPSGQDEVLVVETNLDDMPPSAYEKVFEDVLSAGALDFILLPGLMKKSRPGQKLEVIVRRENLNKVLDVIFTRTNTLGVRLKETRRMVLKREFRRTKIAGRNIRVKLGRYKGDVVSVRPEYEDVKNL